MHRSRMNNRTFKKKFKGRANKTARLNLAGPRRGGIRL